MPIPKPKDGESEREFVDRCMADATMQKEYDDSDQRLAVCSKAWRTAKGADQAGSRALDVERRILAGDDLEVRATGTEEQPQLAGYAAVFDRDSEELGGFVERIDRRAFDEDELADVVATFNHSRDQLLGRRSSGTLRLHVDQVGLRYVIDLPKTSTGRDVYELVKRGDVRGSSFTFNTLSDKWERRGSKTIRTLLRVKTHELGPVTFPAYPDTSVALRSLDHAAEAGELGKKKTLPDRLRAAECRQRLAELEGSGAD